VEAALAGRAGRNRGAGLSLRGAAMGLAAWIQPEPCPPARLCSATVCTLLSLFFFLPGLCTTDNVNEGLPSETLNILRNSKSYTPAPASPKKQAA